MTRPRRDPTRRDPILEAFNAVASAAVWAAEWISYGRRPWPAWYRRWKVDR